MNKQRKRRFIGVLIITFIMAVITVSITECNQRFDEPYNKDYKPVDQANDLSGKVN